MCKLVVAPLSVKFEAPMTSAEVKKATNFSETHMDLWAGGVYTSKRPDFSREFVLATFPRSNDVIAVFI